MRPRYLKIEGLQSFKKQQEIDFQMLGEVGLFGIFGPTGSGKSTILDAITLALYGNVQRAARGTQGIINTDSNQVSVSFIFDLQKNNTRKIYRVDRVYRRKKGMDNSSESKLARLFEIVENEEIILADKEREVTAGVIDLLGLEPSDFTRSVVLPQNQFQEFLLLEKSKKRDMMERIFYLEEYGRKLSDKVNKQLSFVRHKLSNLEGAMSSLGDVSEKALIEAESKMKEAKSNRESIDRELKLVEAEYASAKDIWELTQEQKAVEQLYQQHIQQQESVNDKKMRYEKALQAESLTDSIRKYREIKQKLADTEKKLKEVYRQLPQIQQLLRKAEEDYLQKEEEVEKKVPVLIEKKAGFNHALAVKEEIAVIEVKLKELRDSYSSIRQQLKEQEEQYNKQKGEIQDTEKQVAHLKHDIEKLKVDLDYKKEVHALITLEEELKKVEEEKTKAQKSVAELSGKVSALEKDLEEATAVRKMSLQKYDALIQQVQKLEASKPCDRDRLMQAERQYHYIQSNVGAIKVKKADVQIIVERLEAIKGQLERQKQASQNSEKQIKALEQKKQSIRLELEGYINAYEQNTAYRLAQKLEDGQPCPVCGSQHHPYPADGRSNQTLEEIEQKMKEAQQALTDVEWEYRQAEIHSIKLNEQVKVSENQLSEVSKELAVRQQELTDIIRTLPQHWQDMNIGELELEVESLAKQNENKLKALQEWEQNIEKLKSMISLEEQALSKYRLDESTKNAQLTLHRENLAHARKGCREILQRRQQLFEQYRQAADRLGITSAAHEYRRIESNDRQIEKLQKKMEQLLKAKEVMRQALEQTAEKRQQLVGRYTEIETDGKNLKQQKQEREQKLYTLVKDKDITVTIREIDETIKQLQMQKQQVHAKLQEIKANMEQMNMLKGTLENQKAIYVKEMVEQTERLQSTLQQKGFEDIEQAEGALMSKEQQAQLAKDIQKYQEAGSRLETRRELIGQKLQGRLISEESWEKISRRYVEMQKQKEESISGYESAKNSYNTIKQNFQKWVELNKDYQAYKHKKEMLSEIQKLLKGNSFIEFISEERLRYIAKEASETLGVLTKYRYALELDVENGFVIRDNANGGVCRYVNTLSGGETFLTSLSLALALSKQIQLKGQSPLEFFFLDEGFGTLDASLLDTVIDALERLSTSERVIGLISHVPELKNRMLRRLIVMPPTSDGQGSRISIEKA